MENLSKTAIFSKEEVRKIKETPGIYLFYDQLGKVIYAGKSVNLKNRLRSYLSLPLENKTQRLVSEAVAFSTISVSSEIEALLLEASLVKKHFPKYNIELKDDKHPLYIRITKEEYPQVLLARRIETKGQNLSYYGPFPSSSNVKYVLKIVRKIFPFAQHKIGKRPCLYSQIGQCNPCPNYIESINNDETKLALKRRYRKNIFLIKKVLDGKIQTVQVVLEKNMKVFSKKQKFEEAKEIRNILQKLNYVTQTINNPREFIQNPNLMIDIRKKETIDLKNLLARAVKIDSLRRIECYDVSHIAGANPTASMVTFINGEPEKNLYRRFKIRQKKSQDDLNSLGEVAARRKKHLPSWGVPDLMIIDGGKTQVKVFMREYIQENIPIIGIAKRFETLVIPIDKFGKTFTEIRLKPGPALNLVQRLRNEAHRFARKYHHQLFSTDFLSSQK